MRTASARVSWPVSPSQVKSIQTGTISFGAGDSSLTATINPVVLANSIIIWQGGTAAAATDYTKSRTRVELTDATTVTATRGQAGNTAVAAWLVIEFMPGVLRSVQRGTLDLNGVTSLTATLTTAVNTNKTIVGLLGVTFAAGLSGVNTEQICNVQVVLTDAVTVTASHQTSDVIATVVGYQAAEFY